MPEQSRQSARRRASVVAGLLVLAIAGILVCAHQSFAAARLVECLLVLGVVAGLAWATRGTWRNAMVVGCSLLFGLSVVEGVGLAMSNPATRSAGALHDDSGLSRSRPLVGWGPTRPGVFHSIRRASDGHTVFDTHVTIDATLNRKTVPSTGPHPIAFFGDSWIYGDGVDDDGTLPQAFADQTDHKIPVLNLAFAGWSPAQNLIALQSDLYAPLLQSPRHFVLFTSTFHIERTACQGAYAASQAPRFVPNGTAIKYAGPCAGRWGLLAPIERFARGFAIEKRIEPVLARPTRRDVQTYIKIIETFVATAKAKYDVATTILFVPFSDDYVRGSGYTEAQILDELRKSGADVLVATLPRTDDPNRYWIADDGHPTKLANQLRAEMVKAHLQETDPAALEIIGD